MLHFLGKQLSRRTLCACLQIIRGCLYCVGVQNFTRETTPSNSDFFSRQDKLSYFVVLSIFLKKKKYTSAFGYDAVNSYSG